MAPVCEVFLPDAVLERLRCGECNGYLSSAPIRLLSDGSTICGLCGGPPSNSAAYPELLLENLLEGITFPCRYKGSGCNYRIQFDHVQCHEDFCAFHPCECPFNGCDWRGIAMSLFGHFLRNHRALCYQEIVFRFKRTQSKKRTFYAICGHAAFLSKFAYDAATATINYDLRHLNYEVPEVWYKVHVINEQEPDYSVSLKGGLCLLYNAPFNADATLKELDVGRLLPVLNDPETLVMVLEITLKGQETQTCPWQSCPFEGNVEEVRVHELSCKYRLHCYVTDARTLKRWPQGFVMV